MIINPTNIQELRANGIYAYDPSTINSFIWCPRGCQYKHEMGLVRVDASPAYGLQFGVSGHKAIETFCNEYKSSTDLIDAKDRAIDVFQQEFGPFEEPEKMTSNNRILKPTYTLLFGSNLLDAYFDKYYPTQETLVENELPLAEELIPGIYLAGRVDKIIRKPNGQLKFRDHKFTKYYKKFHICPNNQFLQYKFLVQKLTGEPASGDLDICGVSKTDSLDNLLRREPFDFTKDHMKAWEESTIKHIRDIEQCRKEDFWPQSWNCQPYYKDCAYLPLCSSGDAKAIPKLIQTMYRVEFWDPFSID